jgi:hypothetical protein
MTAIPLPTGMRGKQDSPKQSEKVINAYFKEGTILTRPGVYQGDLGIGKCRGVGKFKEELYQVSSNRLIKITITSTGKKVLTPADIVVTNIGEIEGTANCVMKAGFNDLCIMVKGGKAYIYNDVSGLREITDVSYQASVSVSYDAGRFVFVPEDGGPFFWTELANPASILAVSYADAEEFPDHNKAVNSYKQSIDIMGSRSIERLQYNPNITSYARIQGISSNVGYVGGLTDFGESYAFIGIEDGGYSIYVMGWQPVPIPNDYADELLNITYTQTELEAVRGDTFRWQGQIITLFRLPNHTLVLYSVGQGFDIALWHSETTAKDTGTLDWGFTQAAYGYTWTGNFNSVNIGILTDDTIEFGNDIEGRLQTFYRAENRTNSIISRVFLDCTTGQGNGENEVNASFSRDGKIFGSIVSVSLGQLGDYGKEVSWGPIGMVDNFLGLNFTWIGQVSVNVDGAYIK